MKAIKLYCWFMIVVLTFDLMTMIYDWLFDRPASIFVWLWAILGCTGGYCYVSSRSSPPPLLRPGEGE